MSDIGAAFMKLSRYYLSEDFLPKIERCLSVLDDKQIWWRANPESNSIGNLVLHLSGNVRQWIVCGLGDGNVGRDRDAEFAQRELIPRDELLARLKQTLAEVDETLARFDPGKLLEPRQIQGLVVTALEAVLHVVEHFTMHTGQIIMLAKMFAEVDLEFYDFSGTTPVLTWKKEA